MGEVKAAAAKNHAFRRALERMVGPSGVLSSPEDRLCYSFDATTISSVPALVVLPKTTEQVSAVAALAQREGIPVVPRGAGTGFAGSCVPGEDAIALSTERMNRMLSFSPADLRCVVEPGVVNGDLQRYLAGERLFYPPDPSSLEACTLGGNVAQGASGPRALKYGSTKDYVTYLKVVAPDGEVWETRQESRGYDLLSVLVGSEGTLGVFTAIGLRLLPLPTHWRTFLAHFGGLEEASEAVVALSSRGVIPTVLEVMDKVTLRCVEDYLGRPSHDAVGAVLFVEVTGGEEEVKVLSDRIVGIFEEIKSWQFEFATNEEERESLWLLRRSVSPALARVAPTKINEDVCVPRSRLPELMRTVEALAQKHRVRIYTFGHIGDGNLHVNLMTDVRDREEVARVEECADELFRVTLDLGGTISGEHGIGLSKAKYLPLELGPAGMKVLAGVKRAFDPKGLLNPGKIIASRPQDNSTRR
ncbi:MAG: FAD-binding protein [Candidatus Eisenbacteria bacterium]|nr:FAD-binding protein [Candidatus Eisenbacteria bacterium]